MNRIALALTACAVLCLTGCAAFQTKVAPRVAKAVNVYCLEPQASRQLLRAQINGMIAPNTIAVTCEGDAP